jgi:trehalose/maltose hydrolase-like predicted phosphorylase
MTQESPDHLVKNRNNPLKAAQGKFGPGRLDTAFLEQTPDPWVLETWDPNDPGHRDAFLGNGWMGQRIGIVGDASGCAVDAASLPEFWNSAGCLIHGFWDDTDLMTPPRWATLGYHDGETLFQPGKGEWQDYRQSLDLRTGTLTTSLVWDSGYRKSHILTRCWLSRSRTGIGVIEMEVTPEFDGTIRFIDQLDGSSATEGLDWIVRGGERPGETISLDAKFGPRRRRLAVHSRLAAVVPDEQADPRKERLMKWFLSDNLLLADVTVTRGERMVERTLRVPVKAGETVRVVKVVALASDAESDGPWVTAWNLAESAARNLDKLRAEHEAAWAQLWTSRIEVGNPAVQLILNATLYQMYCNLGDGSPWVPGPTGLSGNAWFGHVFWDDDLWMFPGICLLKPELGRCYAEYRYQTLPGALRNARSEGLGGAMIAWESAEFGDDTIPHLIFHHQHHVNSDVALAQWWYALISGDETFLHEKALPVILGCARFWASRVAWNAAQDRYEVRRVAGADEWAGIRDNFAYTNYSAAWTLRLAARLAKRFGAECPPEWETIAAKLWIPFDEQNQRYFEYDGYNGEIVKQADTALLIYPYELPMSDTIKANTVDYYRQRYPEGNIMMAAAFDGIVDCELGRADKGWESLLRLLPHFRAPYLLVSESPLNETISFITGLGGLLQLVLMGFAGIRLREDGLVVRPCVPVDLGDLTVHGLHFNGVSFDLSIQGGQALITNSSAPISFSIRDRAGNELNRA